MTEPTNDTAQRIVDVSTGVLSKNDLLARRNRDDFHSKGLLVLNVLSSPGSGKTAFIERTLADTKERFHSGVIVGDLATDNDARRIQRTGAPAVQITTGDMCHLEADLVGARRREPGPEPTEPAHHRERGQPGLPGPTMTWVKTCASCSFR